MKTQYPANNSSDEIHVWQKYGKFHCVLPGTAMESPANCEVFDGLGYDHYDDAMMSALSYADKSDYIDLVCYRGEVK